MITDTDRTIADLQAAQPMDGPAQTDKCPTCTRPLPKPKPEKLEAKRERRTWAIAVPKDARENGADVIDSLMSVCAELFGHDGEEKKVKYFTLVQALSLVVQNGVYISKERYPQSTQAVD